jgi:hypothetical protein
MHRHTHRERENSSSCGRPATGNKNNKPEIAFWRARGGGFTRLADTLPPTPVAPTLYAVACKGSICGFGSRAALSDGYPGFNVPLALEPPPTPPGG